jgi:hypothetical protein
MATLTPEQIKTQLFDFGAAFEQAIGTENSSVMIQALTKFATDCPETVQKLADLVEDQPQVFSKLLTPAGVLEAEQMIEMVQAYAPAFQMFGN